jgi:hypothetical protein
MFASNSLAEEKYDPVHLESAGAYVYVLRTKQTLNRVLQWHALIHLVEKNIESGKCEHQTTFFILYFNLNAKRPAACPGGVCPGCSSPGLPGCTSRSIL